MIEPIKDLSKLDTQQKVYEIENYLRQLCEHLNWQFDNLDSGNFNEDIKGE